MESPEGIAEPNPNTKLWRYMSFARFKQLMNSEAFYFARLDCFSDFSEGSMSHYTHEKSREDLAKQGDDGAVADVLRAFSRLTSVNTTYALCLNASERESNLMWRAYGAPPDGTDPEESFKISILSTPQRVLDSFNNEATEETQGMVWGMVQYLDYAKERTPDEILKKAFTKRLEYQDERECRLAIHKPENMPSGVLSNSPQAAKGVSVPIDITSLVEAIYIEPPNVEDQIRLGISGTSGQDPQYAKSISAEIQRRENLVRQASNKLDLGVVKIIVSEVL